MIHTGTNPQNPLPPDLGTFGVKKPVLPPKNQVLYVTTELHLPQIHRRLGLMFFRASATFSTPSGQKEEFMKAVPSPPPSQKEISFGSKAAPCDL